jgi:hypothetical protein
VARVVEEEFRPGETPATTRIVPTDRLLYNQQKNLGAAQTEGEIVIFLDCDVIPEPGTFMLLAMGLLGLLAYAWRKRMVRVEVQRALREIAGVPTGGLPPYTPYTP